jgi:hypothetical protein
MIAGRFDYCDECAAKRRRGMGDGHGMWLGPEWATCVTCGTPYEIADLVRDGGLWLCRWHWNRQIAEAA